MPIRKVPASGLEGIAPVDLPLLAVVFELLELPPHAAANTLRQTRTAAAISGRSMRSRMVWHLLVAGGHCPVEPRANRRRVRGKTFVLGKREDGRRHVGERRRRQPRNRRAFQERV